MFLSTVSIDTPRLTWEIDNVHQLASRLGSNTIAGSTAHAFSEGETKRE